jgi:hypothetical protein
VVFALWLDREETPEPEYASVYRFDNGVKIYSSRSRFDAGEFSRGGYDLGEAKAEFPSPAGTWFIRGRITLTKGQAGLQADGFAILNAKGEVLRRGERLSHRLADLNPPVSGKEAN